MLTFAYHFNTGRHVTEECCATNNFTPKPELKAEPNLRIYCR